MKIVVGDILQSNAQTLINTVNCVGIMGKGIALEFKNRFPDMFADYIKRCERGEVKPGVPYLYRALYPPQIVNFPTKDHWKSFSRIADVGRGLEYLLAHYKEWGITSLAIPPLGCGNGQLEWRIVGPLIYSYAKLMDIPVQMYAPYGTNPRELTEEFLAQEVDPMPFGEARPVIAPLNPAWVALVEILHRIEREPYHWPVGRTIFQKIAYVATREGLPTGLVYQRGSFGPFSPDLKTAETRLINSNLLLEEQAGSMFRVKPGTEFPRFRKQYAEDLSRWESIIERTTDLFMRMNTDQAEIVATVMFAAAALERSKSAPPSETEVLESVMKWKQKRRPPLDPGEVASAIRNLGVLQWLRVTADSSLPVADEEAVFA
jgi:O-acetyl-ADP-ribose deacetylase (regulator of RNase III)/uncharacterized protein YwgA